MREQMRGLRRRSTEYLKQPLETRDYVFLALGTLLIVKSLYTHSFPPAGVETYALSVLAFVLAAIPLVSLDRLTGLREAPNLGLAALTFFALQGQSDFARLVVLVAYLVSRALPRSPRALVSGFYEVTFLSAAWFGGELARRVLLALLPGETAAAAAVYVVVAGYIYFRERVWFSAVLGRRSPSGLRDVYAQAWSGFIGASFVGALGAFLARGTDGALSTTIVFVLAPVIIAGVGAWVSGERNRTVAASTGICRLILAGEEAAEARRRALSAVHGVASEISVSARDLDDLALATLLHDVGKAGMHEYSVEHLLETISSAKGEPLHAERGYAILAPIPGLARAADIIRRHHEPASAFRLDRKTKKRRDFLPHVLNVCVTFAERLAYGEGGTANEREAYKSLKKDAGWDFNPKAVRALKAYLERQGITRLV